MGSNYGQQYYSGRLNPLNHIIGASLSKPHTRVVYGTCGLTDWPTVCVPVTWYWYGVHAHATTSHLIHVCGGEHCSARPRMLTMGRQKAEETPLQQTARLEWERDQRTSSYLCLLKIVGVAIFHVRQFFLPVTSNKAFFTLFYIKHNTCTLHSGQDLWTCKGASPNYFFQNNINLTFRGEGG